VLPWSRLGGIRVCPDGRARSCPSCGQAWAPAREPAAARAESVTELEPCDLPPDPRPIPVVFWHALLGAFIGLAAVPVVVRAMAVPVVVGVAAVVAVAAVVDKLTLMGLPAVVGMVTVVAVPAVVRFIEPLARSRS